MAVEGFWDDLGVAFLVCAGIQIATTSKASGGFPAKASLRMAWISLKGPKAILLIGGISMLFNGIASAVFPEQMPGLIVFGSPLYQSGIALLALNGACLPPAILFLGTSQTPVITFLTKLLVAVLPLKVVHMIESSRAPLSERELVIPFEYRVIEKWEKAVAVLSELSAVILLDTRIISDAVIHEICHVTSSELQRRVFFIYRAGASGPWIARPTNVLKRAVPPSYSRRSA